jgi:hypothetical protein
VAKPTVTQAPSQPPTGPIDGHDAAAPTSSSRFRSAVSRTHVVIAAVAGLVSVGVSLLFQLAPGLKPDPRDNVGADVAIVALEPGVRVREWIERGFRGERREGMMRTFGDQLDFAGELIYVRVAVDGHKHEDVGLRYSLYSARTHRRLPDAINFEPYSRIPIEAPSERSIQLLFVPELKFEPDLFIRAELTDEDGVLAVADSRRIRAGKLTDR